MSLKIGSKYIGPGSIPGVSGCSALATMVREAFQRAISKRLNFNVIWLELGNAYGSVPHQIQLALRVYHVPEDIQVMLDDYFSGFRMSSSTNSYTTDWMNLKIGIAMGYMISPILLVTAMEAAERRAGPQNRMVVATCPL